MILKMFIFHSFNPFMPNWLLLRNYLGRSISNEKDVWVVLIPYFIEIISFNANSWDANQTPHSAASDLGLHCLSISFLWDAMLKLV